MNIYHKTYKIVSLSLTMILWGCDEGRLYEESIAPTTDGLSINVNADIRSASTWPSSYTVSLAAFKEGSDYALVTKSIGMASAETGKYEMTLSNIPVEATSVELCAVDRLRRKVATFWSVSVESAESLTINVESPVDASMFNALQTNVFSPTCANCHGASNFAAAGLYLTHGESYSNLVGVPSSILADGTLRVEKGSRKKSLLYLILSGDVSASWRYDHSVEVVDDRLVELLGSWIDAGALE